MKLYFKSGDAEICYPLSYFKWLLDFENLNEITIFEAERQHVDGFFWCREYECPMDKKEGGCGKECKAYNPKNGKSGCCKNYSTKFYQPTEKCITIYKTLIID